MSGVFVFGVFCDDLVFHLSRCHHHTTTDEPSCRSSYLYCPRLSAPRLRRQRLSDVVEGEKRTENGLGQLGSATKGPGGYMRTVFSGPMATATV